MKGMENPVTLPLSGMLTPYKDNTGAEPDDMYFYLILFIFFTCIKMSCQCQTNLYMYVSRSDQISTPYPTLVNSEQRIANMYPWWVGHWPEDRGTSYNLPIRQYPQPQWPRGMYDSSDVAEENQSTSTSQCPLKGEYLLEPNWAFRS